LWGPGHRPPDLSISCHHPGAQYDAQQLQHGLITDPFLHRVDQLVFRNRVKTVRDVRFDHPPPTPLCLTIEDVQGVVRRTSRAKPETARQEVRLKDRFEHDLQRGSHDPVPN
jgi:hypothetical protein